MTESSGIARSFAMNRAWCSGAKEAGFVFALQTESLTESMRSQLTSRKDSVLAAWRERAAQSVVSHSAIARATGALVPASVEPRQRRLQRGFFSARSFAIDLPALHRSFQALVDRHPSLRTSFREESDRLVQQVHGYMAGLFQRSRSGEDRLADTPKRSSPELSGSLRPAKRPADAGRSFYTERRTTRSFSLPFTTSPRTVGHSSCCLTIYGESIRRSGMVARHPHRVRARHYRTFALAGSDAGRSRRSGARDILVEQTGGRSCPR